MYQNKEGVCKKKILRSLRFFESENFAARATRESGEIGSDDMELNS